jgi:hypothetical protein
MTEPDDIDRALDALGEPPMTNAERLGWLAVFGGIFLLSVLIGASAAGLLDLSVWAWEAW